MNVICAKAFPAPDADGEETGNVLAYNILTRQFRNMTSLARDEDRFARALRWFSEERVLLIEESRVGGSDRASTAPGTAQPVCLTLEGGRVAIDRHPEVQRWYERRRGLVVRRETTVEEGRAYLRWIIKHSLQQRSISFRADPLSELPPRVFLVSGSDFVCIGHEALGTVLASFDGTRWDRVSEHVAIDYDEDAHRLILRSAKRGPDDRLHYWTADLRPLLGAARPERAP